MSNDAAERREAEFRRLGIKPFHGHCGVAGSVTFLATEATKILKMLRRLEKFEKLLRDEYATYLNKGPTP